MSPHSAWMAIGFHLGLADYADKPLSRWEESFIPMRLRDALREVKLADSRPLVQAEEVLHEHRIGQPVVRDEGRVDRVSGELLLHEAPPIDREKPLPVEA